MPVKLSRGHRKFQRIKAYFANPKNKDKLNSFVFNELESLVQQVLTESRTLVLAGSVSSGKKEDLLEVFSNQQEADTRIMLQISDCIKRSENPLQSFDHLTQTSLY